jgi:ATP-dependent DNA helicase RecQ
MNPIVFVDTEIDPKNNKILDIGAVKDNGYRFHSDSVAAFIEFIKGSKYVCGHNILPGISKKLQSQ